MEYCNTCILSDKNKKICQINGIRINLEEDFCSHHSTELEKCEICGQFMLPQGIWFEQDEENGIWHKFCGNCNKLLNTCQACDKFNICPFETDPDPMPKVVVKTIRQGNMTMQTQVKNEERIKKFCHSCNCWNEECGCMKTFNIGCDKKSKFWSSRNP